MRRSLLAFVVAFVVAVSAAPASAADSVWSGLVMANNVPEPTPIPSELNRYESTLKRLFGYNQYQVIGQSRKTLSSGEQDWETSSRYFTLQVRAARASGSVYKLDLQLLQEQKLLLGTQAKLSKASPIVIRGPQVGDGQLILLLVME